jgi:hypothetical protein
MGYNIQAGIDAIIKEAKLTAQNLTPSRQVAFVKQG